VLRQWIDAAADLIQLGRETGDAGFVDLQALRDDLEAGAGTSTKSA
jgi:hypothetical protein